jgi:hypothetical protein
MIYAKNGAPHHTCRDLDWCDDPLINFSMSHWWFRHELWRKKSSQGLSTTNSYTDGWNTTEVAWLYPKGIQNHADLCKFQTYESRDHSLSTISTCHLRLSAVGRRMVASHAMPKSSIPPGASHEDAVTCLQKAPVERKTGGIGRFQRLNFMSSLGPKNKHHCQWIILRLCKGLPHFYGGGLW